MAKRPITAAASGFATRLQSVRMDAGYNDAATFARALGIEPPAYRKWERGDSEPSIAYLAEIQRLTDCSLDWLITGRRPSFAVLARAS